MNKAISFLKVNSVPVSTELLLSSSHDVACNNRVRCCSNVMLSRCLNRFTRSLMDGAYTELHSRSVMLINGRSDELARQ